MELERRDRFGQPGPAGPSGSHALRALGQVGPAVVLAMLTFGFSPAVHAQVIPARLATEWEQLIAAEDSRARTPEALKLILQATRANHAGLRALAVRALGRLERADLADSIAVLLRDAAPAVRVQAAHAFGQALSRDSASGRRARRVLLDALDAERDTAAVAAIAETIGRLRYANAAEARVAIERLLPELDRPAALGAARGLFFLARQPAARAAFDATALAALRGKLTSPTQPTSNAANRTRTLVAATLVTTGRADAGALSAIMSDPNSFVRREAAAALVTLSDTAAGAPLVLRALADASGVVRYEGVRAFARRLAPGRGCEPVLRAVRDAHPHTVLLAIDLLGTSCPSTARATLVLDSIARTLPANEDGPWHRPAHAIVSLAARVPGRARGRLPGFAQHPNGFVRTYAANAATLLRDTATLIQLSGDSEPNVRTAAVQGLARVAGRAADSIYVAQLKQDDSQLLMAAAAALDSTRHAGAASALLDAMDRISRAGRETSRDARAAILQRLRQIGNARFAERIRPYSRDFDPQIAGLAADVLQSWTGTRPEPRPALPQAVALPSYAETVRWTRSRALIQLAGGGEIELELLPFDAPANVARFVRLARAGYFDGLTFHRIAPNFVVQGGSPNANEYAGDGPFSRDELGVENWRGTVGLSTRGRDTGDAQIYINLIDNVRLDHDYTVFARVVRGMDAVDRMLEGAVMRRVTIRP